MLYANVVVFSGGAKRRPLQHLAGQLPERSCNASPVDLAKNASSRAVHTEGHGLYELMRALVSSTIRAPTTLPPAPSSIVRMELSDCLMMPAFGFGEAT